MQRHGGPQSAAQRHLLGPEGAPARRAACRRHGAPARQRTAARPRTERRATSDVQEDRLASGSGAEPRTRPAGDDAPAADAAPQRQFVVQVVHSIAEVDATAWDAAAVASGEVNPFVMHGFLKALEDSHSAIKETGWHPHHILVRESGSQALAGCCPTYLKSHSYGEYVFDHSWASYAARLGQRYYPKLQTCSPFSPVTGPRLLVRDPADAAAVTAALAKGLVAVTDQRRISSSHVTFNSEEESARLAGAGWLQRTGVQYHWQNRGYATFDAFLATLRQGKRKNIRQERKAVANAGLRVTRRSGHELKPSHWDRFYEFYRDTTDRKWGQAYLTREFFHELGFALGDRVMLVCAQEAGADDSPLIAGALNLIGSDAIYGRNWGVACGTFHKHLHFELCMYQAQEEAIERGLARVEAGAQGEHKIQRGYLPARTHSSHYVRDPELRGAIGRHLAHERLSIEFHLRALTEAASPYKPECAPDAPAILPPL